MSFIEIDNGGYQKKFDKNAINDQLVSCFCADWCAVCRKYKGNFILLAEEFPNITFFWIDVEKNDWIAELYEINDFPTLLIEDEKGVRFFGPIKTFDGVFRRVVKHCFSLKLLSLPCLRANLIL